MGFFDRSGETTATFLIGAGDGVLLRLFSVLGDGPFFLGGGGDLSPDSEDDDLFLPGFGSGDEEG